MAYFGHPGISMGRRDDPETPAMKPLQALRRLSHYMGPYKYMVAGAFVLMLATSFLRSLPPLIIGKGLDDTEAFKTLGITYFLLLGGAFFGLQVITAIVGYFSRVLSAKSGQNIIRDIRNYLFNHLQGLSLRFFDNRRTGELMSRTLSDVDMLEWGVLESFLQILNNILLFSFQLAIMSRLNLKLTAIAVAVVPVVLLFALRYNNKAHDFFKGLRERMADLNTVLQESITGIRVVKTFCREDYQAGRFSKETAGYLDLSVGVARMMAFVSNAMSVLGSIAAAIILAYGGWMVLHDQLTVGKLVSLLMYCGMLYGPIQGLVHDCYHLQRSGVAATRVFEVLDTEPEIKDAPDALPAPARMGHVELRNVTFCYRENTPVLEDVCVEAKPGEMVAFVGKSGAGKSTLINLVPRLYDVQSGAVCIDGIDVRKIKYDDLRRNIAMVMQDVFLFNGTIRQNIAYGRLDATEQEIIIASEAAHVDEFVRELPDGYDTQIGERGVKLSGGQRQRISLARAFLANTRLLLLDEPTSNVDTHSERLIQEALEKLVQARTTFVIAHRLSTILRADKIVLLDRGRVQAVGTHTQLLETSPLYAHLYRVQFEQKDDAAPDRHADAEPQGQGEDVKERDFIGDDPLTDGVSL